MQHQSELQLKLISLRMIDLQSSSARIVLRKENRTIFPDNILSLPNGKNSFGASLTPVKIDRIPLNTKNKVNNENDIFLILELAFGYRQDPFQFYSRYGSIVEIVDSHLSSQNSVQKKVAKNSSDIFQPLYAETVSQFINTARDAIGIPTIPIQKRFLSEEIISKSPWNL